MSLVDALSGYRDAVLCHRRTYRVLERLQAGMLKVPLWTLPPVVGVFASGPLAGAAQRSYWAAADPDTLEVSPGVRSTVRVPPERCATGPAAGLGNRAT